MSYRTPDGGYRVEPEPYNYFQEHMTPNPTDDAFNAGYRLALKQANAMARELATKAPSLEANAFCVALALITERLNGVISA